VNVKPTPFTYYMIPSDFASPNTLDVYHGPLQEDMVQHAYPYTDLGPLQSHVHPHFVLMNTAVKLQKSWRHFLTHLSTVLGIHHPTFEATGLIFEIQEVYKAWLPDIKDGGGFKSRAKSSKGSGASGSDGSRSQRSDGKKTGRGNSLPSISEFHTLGSAQGGGGGNVDDDLGNPGMIADISGDSLQDKSLPSNYYYDDEYEDITEEEVKELKESIAKWRIGVTPMAEAGRDQCRVGRFPVIL
jgi:hypothetical protein